MILSWMLCSVAVALLLSCAALAAERILRLYCTPARWVWLIALLAATVWRLPRDFAASAASGFVGRDSLILAVWIATTLLSRTLYTCSLRRLFRELRTCSPSEVGGIPVLVSSELGPAVVGLKRQAIVLPSRVLECEEDVRALIARHELEHVRRGDQYLQHGGTRPDCLRRLFDR